MVLPIFGHAATRREWLEMTNALVISRKDADMSVVPVQAFMSPEEKAQLEAEAKADGVSVSLLIYRRVFDKPDAERRVGRKPKHARNQAEGLFPMTG